MEKINYKLGNRTLLISSLLTALFFLLCLTSCQKPYKDKCYECDAQQLKEVQSFISKNVKSANNMADEEMEDVIIELRETAIKTICKQKQMYIDNQNGNILITKNDTLNYYRFYGE